MRSFIIRFMCGILLLSGAALQAQTKKYGVRSGKITFEDRADLGGFEVLKKAVVTFDDFGLKERRDTYDESGILTESFFCDGENLYLYIPSENTVYRHGKAFRGTEYKVGWEELPADDKASGVFKKRGNVTVAGKDCESYEHITSAGTTVFAGWSGVCLLVDVHQQGMRVTTRAAAFEENIPVPAETFRIPAGAAVKTD